MPDSQAPANSRPPGPTLRPPPRFSSAADIAGAPHRSWLRPERTSAELALTVLQKFASHAGTRRSRKSELVFNNWRFSVFSVSGDGFSGSGNGGLPGVALWLGSYFCTPGRARAGMALELSPRGHRARKTVYSLPWPMWLVYKPRRVGASSEDDFNQDPSNLHSIALPNRHR